MFKLLLIRVVNG